MTTEYYLQEGDVHADVARDLLEQAANPEQVHWSPRPDVPGGGVFVLAEEGIAQRTLAARRAKRLDETARIKAAQAAADERDSDPAVAEGLATPSEAGFPASGGTDPGAAAVTEEHGDDEEPLDDEDADDEPDEAEEKPLTPAQKRAAARAARQQAAEESKTEAKTE